MSDAIERSSRRVGDDIIVVLDRPEELFTVDPGAMLEREARIETGAD